MQENLHEVSIMAFKRAKKNTTKIISLLEIQLDGSLQARIEKISKRTGLSTHNLFQKWILQEETLIGIMRSNKSMEEQTETSRDDKPQRKPVVRRKSTESVLSDTDSLNYRKTLIKMAMKYKKDGMTLNKIAETFNNEKVLTISGTGKWYSSSVANLLKVKK